MLRTHSALFIIEVVCMLGFFLIPCHTSVYPVYASSCDNQSLNISRTCPQRDNLTEYILNLKKGGTDILSTADYDKNFFLCEQYTFDCGYVEDQTESISIANGIQLRFNTTEVDTILPLNASLANTLKRYLNLTAQQAKCGMKVFPLTLTAADSDLFFTRYMTLLVNDIKSKYSAQKLNGTKTWNQININIKTAVCQVIKENPLLIQSIFWDYLRSNNFVQMSNYLKQQYKKTDKLYYLRSAYLIESVTQRCNKFQSVTFLVDESGSIGVNNFQLARDFLTRYINSTMDDLKLTSIHFYDTTFNPHLDFNLSKDQLLTGITSKPYRGGGTNTGAAMNQTIAKIIAQNYSKGLNKIMVVMTDGKSQDNVLAAANYARSQNITLIAVGIGPAINQPELLQIAQTQSNIIKVASYADLEKLVPFIQNFFCKQIINVKVNEEVLGNVVRVPESPAYFRLQKSIRNETFELKIKYNKNPDDNNVVLYRSQYDPFPDKMTEYNITDSQSYRISLVERVYFVTPVQQDDARVKKNFRRVQSFINSYISVGGNNMTFDISLKPCNSTSCNLEKASYKAFGSKKDNLPTTDKEYNIYGIIAGSIAGLACLSLLGALALKKMTGEQDQQDQTGSGDKQLQPELTQQDISDDIRSQDSKISGRKSQRGSRKSDDQIDSRKSGRSGAKKPLNNNQKKGKR